MTDIEKLKKLHSEGKIEKALKLSNQLLKKHPNTYSYLHAHASLHNNAGMINAALRSYLKLHTLNPNDISIVLAISTCFSKISEYESSLKYFQIANKLRPNDHEIIMNIGVLYRLNGQVTESKTYLETGVKLAPKKAEAYHNLAITNELEEDFDTALSNYKKAVELDNRHYRALGNMGVVYSKLKNLKLAEEAFLSSLAINPKYDLALKNLGINYVFQKRLNEAKALLFKAIEYHPKHAMFYNNISQLTNMTKEELSHIKFAIENALASKTNLLATDEMYFALGKICHSLKEYKTAEASYLKANTLVSKKKPYDRSFVSNYFDYSKFLASHLDSSFESHVSGESFVFIIGMPRSGTTLLESLLSTHTKLIPGDELPYLNHICFTELFKNKRHTGLPTTKNLEVISDYYHTKTASLFSKPNILIDKLPHNFRWIPIINTVFPRAKIVHISRDPIDNCWSLFRENFNNNSHEYSYQLKTLAEYYARYQELMLFFNNRGNYNIIDVTYEALVDQPINTIKNIFSKMSINPEDFIEQSRGNSYYSKTASSVQVQQPVSKASIQGWKKHSDFLQPLVLNLQKHQESLGLPIYDNTS